MPTIELTQLRYDDIREQLQRALEFIPVDTNAGSIAHAAVADTLNYFPPLVQGFIPTPRSKRIASMGYHVATMTLDVRYRRRSPDTPENTFYRYYGVPRKDFDAITCADSVGSALHNYVKENYTVYRRVTR